MQFECAGSLNTAIKEVQKMEEKKNRQRVTFQIHAPGACGVFLTGDFNDWDTGSLPLKKDKKNGDALWQRTVYLEPGKHQYRFIIDGSWCDDPMCVEMMTNGFGTSNSVIEVPEKALAAAPKKSGQTKAKKPVASKR